MKSKGQSPASVDPLSLLTLVVSKSERELIDRASAIDPELGSSWIVPTILMMARKMLGEEPK